MAKNRSTDSSKKKKKKKEEETKIKNDHNQPPINIITQTDIAITNTASSSSSSSSSSSFFDSTSNSDDPSSSSTSSELFWETDPVVRVKSGKNNSKRVVACAGTVANVIGKGYVRNNPVNDGGRRWEGVKLKGVFSNTAASYDDAEQFCCSMLGDDCQLSLAVIRDVLGQCGYDVEQALDLLLDLSASGTEQSNDGCAGYYSQNYQYSENSIEWGRQGDDGIAKFQFAERMSSSIFGLSEEEVQQILHSSAYQQRSYSQVLAGPKKQTRPANDELSLPQQVLESLFHGPKSTAHEPDSMNWKNVVKKMEPFGQGLGFGADTVTELRKHTEYAKGEDYKLLRQPAAEHFDAMKSCYLKAATAFSSGQRSYASYLADQGKVHNKYAHEADEKASQEIFVSRNKAIQNTVTIDLHGQHVKQAIRLLKVHLLLFTTYVPSVQVLRVITGCGSHGVGKSKLKNSVIDLIQKAGLQWSEENRGIVLIKLDEQSNFNFVESEDDSD